MLFFVESVSPIIAVNRFLSIIFHAKLRLESAFAKQKALSCVVPAAEGFEFCGLAQFWERLYVLAMFTGLAFTP